jgi:uncharacterized tellurite resistance protein B-like protein
MLMEEFNTKDEAVCHLFLHCCYKDGDFKEKELDYVSGLFVELDMHKIVNFKEAVIKYKGYKNEITDETEFLAHLVKCIHPVHQYALYAYCVEIMLSDAHIEPEEERLLENLSQILEISPETKDLINTLFTQRRAVELEKIF